MDRRTVLAAFNEQIRQHAGIAGPNDGVARDDQVVRCWSIGDGWAGVTWSNLDQANADEVIAAQISRFADLSRPWEWKHYSYDQPADLQDRLRAAGFVPEPEETLLIAEIAELTLDVEAPSGVELRSVTDRRGVDALVSVHDDVFGGDHSGIGAVLLAGLADQANAAMGVVAWAGASPIAAGRVEFNRGTDFASLWGGGTRQSWRGRGVFRSLVAKRAGEAAARGFRYLQVDASAASRPILGKLGFVEFATTTPFAHPGAG